MNMASEKVQSGSRPLRPRSFDGDEPFETGKVFIRMTTAQTTAVAPKVILPLIGELMRLGKLSVRGE